MLDVLLCCGNVRLRPSKLYGTVVSSHTLDGHRVSPCKLLFNCCTHVPHSMLLQSELGSPVNGDDEEDTPELLPGRRQTRGRASVPADVARDEPAPKRTRGITRARRYQDYDDEFEDVRPCQPASGSHLGSLADNTSCLY